ncbi:hypothetical protein [Streptosporangium sp. NPDC000396]|uniref:hypothetical protein n=1 Tax=Streptosporangium sp. NPDC000396 TaxID=3366185 RepID=UPI00368D8FBD
MECQGPGHFGRHRHATSGQPQDNHALRVDKPTHPLGQAYARIMTINEHPPTS